MVGRGGDGYLRMAQINRSPDGDKKITLSFWTAPGFNNHLQMDFVGLNGKQLFEFSFDSPLHWFD